MAFRLTRLSVAVNVAVVPAKLLRACLPLHQDRRHRPVVVTVVAMLEQCVLLEPSLRKVVSSVSLLVDWEEVDGVHYFVFESCDLRC
jgi:hypothetical protein